MINYSVGHVNTIPTQLFFPTTISHFFYPPLKGVTQALSEQIFWIGAASHAAGAGLIIDLQRGTLAPHPPKTAYAHISSKVSGELATRRASKDGSRFRCILCAVGRVKADRKGPKGHTGLAGWGLEGQVCPGEPEACPLQG